MPTTSRRSASLSRRSLLALALAASLPGFAAAAGPTVDVQLIDRDAGYTLPVYRYRGQNHIPGNPGSRYAIALRNLSGERVLAVVSVDGVNVVTGQTAAWNQSGYVLEPYQSYEITGWRKSDREIAAFEFTSLGDSYAARTGRPFDVGVVGVASFRERRPPPWRDQPEIGQSAPAPYGERRSEKGGAASADKSARESAAAAPQLGTGHGERETSWVNHTTFERARSSPDEVVALRYDSRENLVAQGIIPAPRDRYHGRPRPFPDAPSVGYVPDPPPRRWGYRNDW